MTLELLIEIVGWISALMILVAYLLLSAGKLAARSVAYQALNLFGAIGFVVNSGWNGAIPSASLNVIWALIALVALVRVGQREGTNRT